MTKRLPLGTRNVALNMLQGEFRLIDKLAFDSGLSTNEFIRRKLRLGIAMTKPAVAKSLIRIRRARREIGSAVLLVLFSGWLVAGGGDVVRAARSVRPRGGRRNEWELIG